jgi:uncharacterized protein YbbK (DUF523 family)
MKVIVSACLLGRNCKYNGGNNYDPKVAEFAEGKEVIAVCPEELAGLGIPRSPIEIVDGEVRRKDGTSVDAAVREAIGKILAQVRDEPIQCAILKSRSPTCGVRQVYDGTFSGTLIDGSGLLAQALMNAGYTVLDAEEI